MKKEELFKGNSGGIKGQAYQNFPLLQRLKDEIKYFDIFEGKNFRMLINHGGNSPFSKNKGSKDFPNNETMR